MSYSKYQTEKIKGNIVVEFLKGLILAMLISFALVIVLAFCLKWFSLDEKIITPINITIKIVSVVIGALVAIKGESRGMFKGVFFGALYIMLAVASFSFLSKSFVFDLSLILDMVCSCLAGGIVGVIKVNSR